MIDAYYDARCDVSVSPPTVSVQFVPAVAPPPPPNVAWLYRDGVRAIGRELNDGPSTPVSFPYIGPGTYTLRIYTHADVLVSESAPFAVPAVPGATTPVPTPTPSETGTLSGLPTSGTAGTALAASGTFSLANAPNSGTTAYVGLFNVTAGAYQGALQAITGTSGSLPTLTPATAATYAVRLCADSAGATVLATSPNIAVAAAAAAPAPAPTPAPTPRNVSTTLIQAGLEFRLG